MTIGEWGEKISADKARERARDLLAEAQLGDDPVNVERRRRKVPTFKEWIQTYLRQRQREQKRSTFWKTRWNLDRAAELLGNAPLDEITRDDLQAARLDIAERRGNVSANRWLSVVRASLNEAAASGHINGNPASGIKRLREGPPRQRILDESEMERFNAAIAAHPDPHVRCAFRMLIGTGARRGEVLCARCEDVDLGAGTWRTPDPKSGQPQILPLSEAVVEMLRETPGVQGSPWLIPSNRDPSKHKYDLFREWAQLCTQAKIGGAVIHDLRRTFGARIARIAGLHIASRLLRHKDIKVTEAVYAPIDEKTLREALRDGGAGGARPARG